MKYIQTLQKRILTNANNSSKPLALNPPWEVRQRTRVPSEGHPVTKIIDRNKLANFSILGFGIHVVLACEGPF